jgi:chaperonin cofactor prefoldin
MDRTVLLVLCLVTLSNVQLGQSQSDVVRIAAAVYEAIGPALETMQKDMKNVKSDLASLSQKVDNLTAEVEKLDTRLSSLNESMRDDFDDVKTELNGVSNTTTAMCDKIEKHETAIKSDLKDMKENLTQQITGYTVSCGGVGWRRAVYLDMTDPNTNCPSGWLLTGNSKRTCGHVTHVSTGSSSCDSVFFPVSGGPYSQVCGRIRAYQWGLPRAFHGYSYHGQTAVDSVYFDGVAVMHGIPQQHIWTFAAGSSENATPGDHLCPCDTTGNHISIPPFVGEDYFCESGYVHGSGVPAYRLHSNDTLWDGEDCHSTSTCCSFHNPPYFTKTLNQTTSDDLELRMCLYDPIRDENIAVELVELYVK